MIPTPCLWLIWLCACLSLKPNLFCSPLSPRRHGLDLWSRVMWWTPDSTALVLVLSWLMFSCCPSVQPFLVTASYFYLFIFFNISWLNMPNKNEHFTDGSVLSQYFFFWLKLDIWSQTLGGHLPDVYFCFMALDLPPFRLKPSLYAQEHFHLSISVFYLLLQSGYCI